MASQQQPSPELDLSAQLDKKKAQKDREEFIGLKLKSTDIEDLIFGEPNLPSESPAHRAWLRLQENKGNQTERQRIMLEMRRTAEKIFDTLTQRLRSEGETKEETEEKLEALDAYLRTAGVIGQTLKTIESPYSTSSVEGLKANQENMETSEAFILGQFVENLKKLNVDELINMILEDQGFVTMLYEEAKVDNRAIKDIVPVEMLADQDKADGKHIDKLDPENPLYWHNLKHLRDFIIGKAQPEGKEKSQSRRAAEMTLWVEIVRSLEYKQKRDLMSVFLEEDASNTKEFIHAFIIANCMTKEDAMHMYGEGGKFEKLGKDFEAELDSAVKAKQEREEKIKSAVEQIETVYQKSAVNNFFTFNNLIMSRVIDWGFLTASLNLIVDVADRYRRRLESGRKEGMVEAGVKGVADALKNPWFYAGVGAMAGATEVIYPWMKSAMLSPSDLEKKKVAEYNGIRFLRESVGDHPGGKHAGLADYFLNNYDSFFAAAKKNYGEKDKFDLLPGDIKISEENANRMGFNSESEAHGAIIRMFDWCAKFLKADGGGDLDTSKKVARFFDKRVYKKI